MPFPLPMQSVLQRAHHREKLVFISLVALYSVKDCNHIFLNAIHNFSEKTHIYDCESIIIHLSHDAVLQKRVSRTTQAIQSVMLFLLFFKDPNLYPELDLMLVLVRPT
jgi:hypothetical protein